MNKNFSKVILFALWLALFGVVNIYMNINGLSETRGRALIIYIPIVLLTLVVIREKKYVLNQNSIIIFFIYIISIVLSSLINTTFLISTVIPTIIGIALLLFVFSQMRLEISEIAKLMSVIVWVGISLIICNIYLNGLSFFSMNYFLDSDVNYYASDLSNSIFLNKNTWGMVLTSCFIANSYCTIVYKNKVLYKLIQLIFLISILFSGARASIVVCYVFQMIFFMFQSKKNIISGIIFNVVLCFFIWFLYQIDIPFISDFLFRSNDITSGRTAMVLYGLKIWLDQPIFGYGIGNEEQLLQQAGFSVGSTHNNYVDWLLEGGVLYLLINIILLLFSIKKAIELRGKSKKIKLFHISSVIAYMVYSLMEYMKLFVPSINCIYLAFVCVYAVFLYENLE